MNTVNLKLTGDTKDIMPGVLHLKEKLNINFSDSGLAVKAVAGKEKLKVFFKNDEYVIEYSIKAEFFRGLAFLLDAIRNHKDIKISEKRNFETTGVMLDVSRGAVYTKETVFDILQDMALMGLNMFMLYTEDTYEMKKYPYFGYMRGAYTAEELKAIDDYGDDLGIELIPCIQTLAHLRTALRWPYASPMKDTDDTLMVGEKETYEFIDEMMKVSRECFRSHRIHIGMDEAMNLGLGKYLRKNGYRSNCELMIEHLTKVCEIAEKYEFYPMMWSDMFFRMSGEYGEYDLSAEIPEDISERIPENIEMVYWDYCMEDREVTDSVIEIHGDIERPVVFAGGIWTWNRICTGIKKSYRTAKEQLPACKERGINTVFATIWNNSESDYNLYSTLPGLQIWAELTYDTDASFEKIAERFKICTGYDFEDWKALYVDDFTDAEEEKYRDIDCFCINSSIQHFYNDILFGILDKSLEGYDFKSHYEKYLDMIEKSDCGDMELMFRQHKVLYRMLRIKCDMGTRLRKAYKEGDREIMKDILSEIGAVLELHREYHKIIHEAWHKMCKPFGYEALDAKLATAEARVETAYIRVRDYLDGKIDSIPELEVEIRPYGNTEGPLFEVNAPGYFMSVYNV